MNPYFILGGVLAGVALFLGGYAKGFHDAAASHKIKDLQSIVESDARNENLRQEIIRLPADELKRRYCKWVRDSEQECLQADIPLG